MKLSTMCVRYVRRKWKYFVVFVVSVWFTASILKNIAVHIFMNEPHATIANETSPNAPQLNSSTEATRQIHDDWYNTNKSCVEFERHARLNYDVKLNYFNGYVSRKNKVCLTTQLTISRFEKLEIISELWKGK